jgi:hypothetical protein
MQIDPVLQGPNALNPSFTAERFSSMPQVSIPIVPVLGSPTGVVVEISREGQAAYERSRGVEPGEIAELMQCLTCRNRKYVDSSNDPSVSFQSPSHINPGAAASVVAAHEREHVSNEQAKADREDRKIVSQTVSLHTSSCPECGRIYVSGGTTRTLSKADSNNMEQPVDASAGCES